MDCCGIADHHVGNGVCGCCGALRPRYKRLVDNIFPEDPEDGLVKVNMEKLTFYALSAPEKLDRIGAYLAERLSRDVARHRYGYVCIAMEALDQLLMACHCQSINLFVESFLKMVAKLLESDKAALQILGTNSFIKFANIEEDTPSYHRSYDFFVSRFSEMCHSGHDDATDRMKIRMAGIKGLQGVVRKTVNDELQANIWEPQHMDKIVPSLLFNLQQAEEAESIAFVSLFPMLFYLPGFILSRSLGAIQWPRSPGEAARRGAVTLLKAGKPRSRIYPTHNASDSPNEGAEVKKMSRSPSPLQATDNEKESPPALAEGCFRELLGRAAYGNIKNAVKPVLIHLDNHSLWEPKMFAVRCFKIIMYSVQSQHSHLVIQQLVGHLDANSKSAAKVRTGIVEVLSESAVIAAGGSVGPTVLEVFNTLLRHLRLSIDYELTGNDSAPNISNQIIKEHEERVFQEAVIKTIGTFANTLPAYQRSEVMLFIIGKVPLPAIHQVLDVGRPGDNGNRMIQLMLLKSLLQVTIGFQSTNLLATLPTSFLEPLLSASLMEDAELRLLVIEILLSLIDRQGNRHKFSHVSIVSDISLLMLKVDKCSRQDTLFMKKHSQTLYRYIYMSCKQENNSHIHYDALYAMLALISVELANEEVVVDLIRVVLALQVCAVFFNKVLNLHLSYLCSIYEDRLSKRKSIGETISLQVEVESRNSPEKEEKMPTEEITFETLKKAIDGGAVEEQERERRRLVVEKFQKAPFEEIAAHCGARATILQSKLNQIFEITIRPPPSPSGTITAGYGQTQTRSVPVYEMKFPDLCVY
ncbi:protein EFR3 homolog B [Scyliorhinus canicula]|nr:protein EFR3 homolog B [Scyliorhinus canicula]